MARWILCATLVIAGSAAAPAGDVGIGPDVLLGDVTSVRYWGAVGNVHAYSFNSHTCNIGDAWLDWNNQFPGTPALTANAYRLQDGRIEQIGLSWVKYSCCASQRDGCGLECTTSGLFFLGAGCKDIYSSPFNGSQSQLTPRSHINAFSGALGPSDSTTGDTIYKRLQIAEADMDIVANPDALYFLEGVYVAPDDAAAGNALNNATYFPVTPTDGFALLQDGPVVAGEPAIFAWQAADPDVKIATVDVPGEGRFYAAGKATENGDGTWHYEYAVFNLNSDRAADGLTVPRPPGATISNVGFRDVDYHSGEVYDGTDWLVAVDVDAVRWSSPATYAEDPDTNALRYATLYNFWFDADQPPADAAVTLKLFKPGLAGEPDQVAASNLPVPARCPNDPTGAACDSDLTADCVVNNVDLGVLLSAYLQIQGQPGYEPSADYDDSGAVDNVDLGVLLSDYLNDCR